MALALRRTGLAPPICSNHQDYAVIDGGREVGRIYGDRTPAAADAAWFWSIIVIGARHAGIKTDGRAATFYDAKAQFEDNYRKWLAWAKLEQHLSPVCSPPGGGGSRWQSLAAACISAGGKRTSSRAWAAH
jgi:hypothetical protein